MMTDSEIIAHLLVDNLRLRLEIEDMHAGMWRMVDSIWETLHGPVVLPPPRPLETVIIDGVECDLL